MGNSKQNPSRDTSRPARRHSVRHHATPQRHSFVRARPSEGNDFIRATLSITIHRPFAFNLITTEIIHKTESSDKESKRKRVSMFQITYGF